MPFFLILLWVFLFYGGGSLLTWKLKLAHRTGKPYCWVKFYLPQSRQLCISEKEWKRWLFSPQQKDWEILEATPVRETSPLKNDLPTSFHKKKEGKKVFWIQRPSLVDQKDFSFQREVLKKIERFREELSFQLRQQRASPVLLSLLLHEGCTEPSLGFLRKLGFVHLATVSGIHLYVIQDLCSQGIKILTRFFHLPIPTGIFLSRLLSFFICGGIWILSGARFGMLRPWCILLLKQWGELQGFRWKKGIPLVLILVLELLWEQLQTQRGYTEDLSLGRWVYALAAGGSLVWLSCFPKSPFWQHGGLAISSWLGVALWEIFHTGTVSLATPLLSLISLPLICFGVYPALLCFFIFQSLGFSSLGAFCLSQLQIFFSTWMDPLVTVSLLPGNVWLVSGGDLLWGALGSSLLALFFPSGFAFTQFRFLGVAVALFLFRISFLPVGSSSTASFAAVEQLDVGQGDAALILGEKKGLMDVGSEKALSPSQWMEILAHRKLQRLDWVGLSHLDEDHQGGLKTVGRLLPVGCVTFPDDLQASPAGEKLFKWLKKHTLSFASWESACIPFPHFQTRGSFRKPNEVMGGIWVPLRTGVYVAAGDLPESREKEWLEWMKDQRKEIRAGSVLNHSIQILKISHHGSKTSTGKNLLQILQPQRVWISVGKKNRYRHPSPLVIERLREWGGPVFRTDRDGNLFSEEVLK